MLYGLYTSAQGIQAQSFRVDVIANNLANASTTGFKRDLAIFQSHRPYDVENGLSSEPPGNQNALSGGLSTSQVATDFSTGPMTHTGATYDVALTGHGFFQVSDGQQRYLTRNGQFTVATNGDLVAQGSGMRVQSTVGGPISIPAEAVRVEIADDGTLTTVGTDGAQTQLARLALVQPASEGQLQKIGNSLYRTDGSVSPAGPDLQVRQGYVEGSGVSAMSEMVQMIQASRAAEANVNMIKFQDDALDRLLQAAAPH
jgi:flagellar basal body rod protein FlgG